MTAKRPDASAMADALDKLYAAPFEGFVSLRRELSAGLRAAGDLAAARTLGAANKPTRTAWALNQVARNHPALVEAIIDSWRAAAAAQKSRDADAIREGVRRYREAIGEAVRAARSILAGDGVSLSIAQARRMSETLQALATDETERARLLAGRLTQDVPINDPFAGLEVSTPGRQPKPLQKAVGVVSSKRANEQAARQAEAARVRQERQRAADDAHARVAALERSVAEARSIAAAADRARERAEREVAVAQSALGTLEEDLARARERLKQLS
ncbi:MAG: hypothetical protein WBY94_25925 [Polyangiaceae bacterium]